MLRNIDAWIEAMFYGGFEVEVKPRSFEGNLLIIDTETSGLEADDCCIEVGAVLYNVSYRSVLASFGSLVWGYPPDCTSPYNNAQGINRIPPEATALGVEDDILWKILEYFEGESEAVLAHNAKFDRQWFDGRTLPKIELPWLDSLDLRFPNQFKQGDNLLSLAQAHDVPIGGGHRALDDCLLLSRLLSKHEDLAEDLERIRQPKVFLRAMVAYEDRQLAKDANFRWNSERKEWLKEVFCFEVQEIKASLGFEVQEVENVS